MNSERYLDISSEYPEFNFQNPLFRRLNLCKKIAPKDNRTVEIKGREYSSSFPRIVKTNFIAPKDWIELKIVQDGEELAPGMFHSCKKAKRDNSTVDGFYVTTRHRFSPRVVLSNPADDD